MDAFPYRRRAAPARPIASVLLATALIAVACTPAGTSPTPTAPASVSPVPASPAASQSPGPSATAAGITEFPVTLTDVTGEAVEITAEPRTIVSLTPAATETLYALGAGDRVVGKVEDIANFPPEAGDVPVVATFAGVDVEKIVALEPDLVVAGGNGGTADEAIERMRALDLPVLVQYAADVPGVLRDIEQLGAAVGEGDAARDLTASMQAGFDQVAEATRDVERPRVFYETGDQPALYGVADDSFVAGMLELAGAEPITTGSPTVWEMSQERLIQADPEIILLGDAAYGVTAEAVAARPGWADLTAVKAGAIRPIDDIVVTRPGPRLLEGLRALVAAIHPDIDLPGASPAASRAPGHHGAPPASPSAAPSVSGG